MEIFQKQFCNKTKLLENILESLKKNKATEVLQRNCEIICSYQNTLKTILR